MKVKELIANLLKMNQEAEAVVFRDGDTFPILETQEFDGEAELCCGWSANGERGEER